MSTSLLKKYVDSERPKNPLYCYDCKLRYDDEGWCDILIPDEYWEKINPTYNPGGGILCFNCIAKRLVHAGLGSVPFLVKSGPFETDYSSKG